MSQICSKMVNFIFQPMLAVSFVTIATVKVKIIPYFYTWAIVLKTNKKNFVKKAIFIYFLIS